jgi:hypothetical protein
MTSSVLISVGPQEMCGKVCVACVRDRATHRRLCVVCVVMPATHSPLCVVCACKCELCAGLCVVCVGRLANVSVCLGATFEGFPCDAGMIPSCIRLYRVNLTSSACDSCFFVYRLVIGW